MIWKDFSFAALRSILLPEAKAGQCRVNFQKRHPAGSFILSGTPSHSRRVLGARFAISFSALCNERAWGMPGAQCTRSLVRAIGSEYAHEYSQRVHRISPAFPHAMVYGL
jgi:hypothetical protein